jgi:hypothetical protein
VYTLYNSQQLSLFSCSEDPGSNSATNSYGVPCHHSLTGAAPLSNTPPLNYLLTTHSCSVAANVRLYRPRADHKENTSPIPVLLEWRHYRNGLQRKRWSLPLLRCMATACKQASYCWLLTHSVHVTILRILNRTQTDKGILIRTLCQKNQGTVTTKHNQLRRVPGLLTGHSHLKGHLFRMGLTNSPICERCL